MTPREALKEISHMVYRNTDDFEMRISKDCYKNIVSALLRQIPKKPKNMKQIGTSFDLRTERHTHYFEGLCPTCEKMNTNRRAGEKKTYCEMCGQKLDWGNTE